MAMEALREARELERAGRHIVHMELGEPGAPVPRRVREAAQAALARGALGYGEAMGDLALRRRIAGHYQTRYGVGVSPDRVIVTTGSSGGFMLALLAASKRFRCASTRKAVSRRRPQCSKPRIAKSRSTARC
jgi:aspartate/methionine/tyrosine aminotransferase